MVGRERGVPQQGPYGPRPPRAGEEECEEAPRWYRQAPRTTLFRHMEGGRNRVSDIFGAEAVCKLHTPPISGIQKVSERRLLNESSAENTRGRSGPQRSYTREVRPVWKFLVFYCRP